MLVEKRNVKAVFGSSSNHDGDCDGNGDKKLHKLEGKKGLYHALRARAFFGSCSRPFHDVKITCFTVVWTT